MCFIGAFPVYKGIVIASTIGILLNAAYFLWAFQRIFFGKLNEKYVELPEINKLEMFTVIPLLIITLFFGIYPAPYLDLISGIFLIRVSLASLPTMSPIKTIFIKKCIVVFQSKQNLIYNQISQ